MAGSSPFLGLRGNALMTAQTLLVVLPAFVLFGYNQSNLGGLVSLSDWTDHFPQIDTKNYTGAVKSQHATIQGVVIATFTLGAMVGCLSCSYTADKFGRRMVIFAGALLSLIGMVLECSAFQLAQLVVGRTILGAGVGMLSGTVPTWWGYLFSYVLSTKMCQETLTDSRYFTGRASAAILSIVAATLSWTDFSSVWDTCYRRGSTSASTNSRPVL